MHNKTRYRVIAIIISVLVIVSIVTITATSNSQGTKDNTHQERVIDPCLNLSKEIQLDTKTTLYVCNNTDIQLRQRLRSVTFTLKEWEQMYEKRHAIYQAMGLFVFNDVRLKIGRARKVTVLGYTDLKGITLTEYQVQQLLEWNRLTKEIKDT